MNFKKNPDRFGRHIASMPFIYAIIVPAVLLDITVEVYHRICFPLYGLKCLKRSDYIRIDRHKLKYLNFVEKINCAYCGYCNGLFPYVAAIAAETEKYWCGIKHKKYNGFKEPAHHKTFVPYGDKKAMEEKYTQLKK
jgi:hypothetical protein